MPELPEVETIRKQLEKKIVGKVLGGKIIQNVKRRGKMLVIGFQGKEGLVFHLKLAGQLIFNGIPGKYTRQVFHFSDGARLVFNDVRKFGWARRVKDISAMKEIRQLGPDALAIKEKDFQERLLKRKNAKIKSLLMDQKFIAGIGNIYSDEILFDAKIHPLRGAKSLTKEETSQLFLSVKKILRKAIEQGGSSVKDYIDTKGEQGGYQKYHKVYQKTGKPCVICQTPIKRIKLGGRSAHYCPSCQK